MESSDVPFQQHKPAYGLPRDPYGAYNSTTQDESTFIPYCDASNASVAASGQGAPPPAPPPSIARVGPDLPKGWTDRMSSMPQSEILEVTQGFTQFDIKHPESYDAVSTPAHQKSLHRKFKCW